MFSSQISALFSHHLLLTIILTWPGTPSGPLLLPPHKGERESGRGIGSEKKDLTFSRKLSIIIISRLIRRFYIQHLFGGKVC
jgi:hypothetical protein